MVHRGLQLLGDNCSKTSGFQMSDVFFCVFFVAGFRVSDYAYIPKHPLSESTDSQGLGDAKCFTSWFGTPWSGFFLWQNQFAGNLSGSQFETSSTNCVLMTFSTSR